MIPTISQGESQRQRAFRHLARARELSLTGRPDADHAYCQAKELATQAVNDSPSPLETDMALQLQKVVNHDHRRHGAIL